MHKKRIVKETRADNSIQYRVEYLSLLKNKWQTDGFYDAERDCWFEAIFNTLVEAKIHLGIDTNPVVKREIL